MRLTRHNPVRGARRLAGGFALATIAAPAIPAALQSLARLFRRAALAGAAFLVAGLTVCGSHPYDPALLRYRATLQELGRMAWSLPAMAAALRRPMRIIVDAEQGAVRLVALQAGPRQLERVEQTIWLPEGLEVQQVTEAFTASPEGWQSPASLTLIAPAYNRLFRVTTDGRTVRREEAPAS